MEDEIRDRVSETTEEIEQAVADLAVRLAEMDGAQGVFGETVSDEIPDDVAGGIPEISAQPLATVWVPCQYPGCVNVIKWNVFRQKRPPKYCEPHRRL